jgi:hypothetical protein
VRFAIYLAVATLVGGCASYGGRGLATGQATEADIVALMGKPALTLDEPGGGKAYYFPRQPWGRQSFKVVTGPDGRMKDRQQVLTAENIKRIQVGTTTKEQAQRLLGPPSTITRATRKPLDVWEYPWLLVEEKRILWISFSDDGIVREVIEMHDLQSDEPTMPG